MLHVPFDLLFHFGTSFDVDVSNASFRVTVKKEDESWQTGTRNSVEMVKANTSGDSLYITVKQVSDNISEFAKFKVLIYKNGKIVGSEWGYLSIHAENLSGKDTTDVIRIYLNNQTQDADSVTFIFEPW